VKTLGKRTSLWRELQQFVRVLDDGTFDLDEVADQFGGGPSAFAGTQLPVFRRHGIGDG
jgi:hypothetical protein